MESSCEGTRPVRTCRPPSVHFGIASQIRAGRAPVLTAVYAAHPDRFVNGIPTPPHLRGSCLDQQAQGGACSDHPLNPCLKLFDGFRPKYYK
jgi:hypothetical protein